MVSASNAGQGVQLLMDNIRIADSMRTGAGTSGSLNLLTEEESAALPSAGGNGIWRAAGGSMVGAAEDRSKTVLDGFRVRETSRGTGASAKEAGIGLLGIR